LDFIWREQVCNLLRNVFPTNWQIINMTTELTYPELISKIRLFSLKKKNGTIFILSNDGHIARIVLNEGTITYLIFDSNHNGSEAIPYIQAIKLARIQFVHGHFESSQAGTLPSTTEILARLSAKTMTPEQGNDFSISSDLNKAIKDIKIILATYIGPFANVLCNDYIQQFQPDNTKNDLIVMIETLADEIDTPNEQEEFKKKILKEIFHSNK